jgi:hypothetical protein
VGGQVVSTTPSCFGSSGFKLFSIYYSLSSLNLVLVDLVTESVIK